MRLMTSLMLAPALAGSLLLASGCATKAPPKPIYPPSADLVVEAKPELDPSAVKSEAALDAHEIALEVWADKGWAQVTRLCQWAVNMGAKGLTCQPPSKPG